MGIPMPLYSYISQTRRGQSPDNSGGLGRLRSTARRVRLLTILCSSLMLAFLGLLTTSRWAGGAVADAAPQITTTPVTTVSAASFEVAAVAPDSIVAAFGANLATQTVVAGDIDPVASGIQLPTSLGGSSVEVGGRLAEILFVSPGQINYIVPGATPAGAAPVIVRAANGSVSNGAVTVARVAPAIFTANSSGRGAAAALLIRVRADGTQIYESVAEYNQPTSQFITRPIDLGPVGERVFLVLFLSGLRGATDPNGDGNLSESVRILLGGAEVAPVYAGRQPEYLGLDQVNAELPRELIGRGRVTLAVTVRDVPASNPVEIEVGGVTASAGITVPIISGFDGPTTLAGQQLLINGSGFSPVATQNTVRISGIEAEVITASASQLRVEVPYGISSGPVQVRNQSGEGSSSTILNVRTSISGVVEDTLRNPIPGLTVRLSGTTIRATTNAEGTFVLADVPPGVQLVEIDGASLDASPPFPVVVLKIAASANRDNAFQRTIAIQQAIGSSATIGAPGGQIAPGTDAEPLARLASPEQTSTLIRTDNIELQVQPGAKATFPNGQSSGRIWLTRLENARTFVSLPTGYFSSNIVQITPFNVRLDPGARLTFPNTDGLAPGTQLTLFRFSEADGRFVPESTPATVTADGRSIETALNAVRISSAYFAAAPRQTTTIIGRVVENDGFTPVRRAVATFRGQESFTDGTGSYVIRAAPVAPAEKVGVEISLQRPGGRVDRATSPEAVAAPGGITLVGTTRLPPLNVNRPPVIVASPYLIMVENLIINHTLIISDPDQSQAVEVSLRAPAFATLVKPTSPASKVFSIRLAPGLKDAGNYSLVVSTVDSLGATTSLTISLQVLNLNQLPQVFNLNFNGIEDTDLPIQLEGADSDAEDSLNFSIVMSPTNGALTGQGRNWSYRPRPNYYGPDLFTYRASDGQAQSEVGVVVIVVAPVNDPPELILPPEQTVTLGNSLSVEIRATNVEPEQLLRITTGSLPAGVTFIQSQPAAGILTWKPSNNQLGSYTILFTVTDTGLPPASTSAGLKVNIVR